MKRMNLSILLFSNIRLPVFASQCVKIGYGAEISDLKTDMPGLMDDAK